MFLVKKNKLFYSCRFSLKPTHWLSLVSPFPPAVKNMGPNLPRRSRGPPALAADMRLSDSRGPSLGKGEDIVPLVTVE